MVREIVERRRGGPSAARPDDGERLADALEKLTVARDPIPDPDIVPWLVELWASGRESDVVRTCLGSLTEIARRWRGHTSGQEVMAEALAEPGSFARFGRALDPRLPHTSEGWELALLIFMPFTDQVIDRDHRSTGRPRYPLARKALERREWVHALAALRDDEWFSQLAYWALHGIPPERVPPLPPAPPASRPRGDALTRYRAGDHVGAWQSLSDAGRLGADAREEARAVAEEMMRIVRANAEIIVEVSNAADYPFAEEPLSDPRVVRAELRELTSIVGGSPPVSLEVFWEVVGGIDLCRREDGDDCELDVGESSLFRNPLQVLSPEGARWCIDGWKSDPRRAPWLGFQISADTLHKEWTSGGSGYWIRIPSEGADGRVYGEPHDLAFVPYLRLNFAHCGFLGYEHQTATASYRRLAERVKHRLAPF